MQVLVCYAHAPRSVRAVKLEVADDATVLEAVRASGLLHAEPDLTVDPLEIAIRCRKVALTDGLQHGDRIDICRPLKVDPKLARRQRFVAQGAKTAGLFAKRRPGSKAGY